MQTYADMDLLDLRAAFPILEQNPLHTDTGFYRADRILEAGEDGIPDRLHYPSARSFDDWEQDTVMTIDHRHVLDIALFLSVSGGSFDIAEQDCHRRAQLLEL